MMIAPGQSSFTGAFGDPGVRLADSVISLLPVALSVARTCSAFELVAGPTFVPDAKADPTNPTIATASATAIQRRDRVPPLVQRLVLSGLGDMNAPS
ncbi:MAG TPA: hypothetical protein VFV19_01960 [Candidatus Polarisedimenticolaceae bacterium]|nr:hypothetical protein [Candidatus Polarisedimenticolaceae bacterium]